ncbi:hypothetical protein F2Q70_00038182 [Brassica cretica]|uniref:Uncharacterized protein n=1 Tax=Brassica cretica TaxID=69181 RepID=A0A8S9K6X5_BRACR|nr:hypothetical protein F2Q70_00038182 [Brassica cretica]
MDSWSLEISRVTRRLFKDPAITRGPGGRTKIRRSSGNPEVVGEPRGGMGTRRFFDRFGDRNWKPEVAWEPGGSSLDPEISDWNPEAMWELGDLEVFDWNPEAIGELGGSCSDGPRCSLGCTGILGSFDSILRLAHTHSCFMSHTHFDFVDVQLWSCHFWEGLARIGGLWRPDPARMPSLSIMISLLPL